MQEIPVGSVCVIVQCGNVAEHFVGLECTVVEGVDVRKSTSAEGKTRYMKCYGVLIQGHGDEIFNATPASLRLKKLPPDEAFDKFLNKITQQQEGLV